MLKLFSYVVDHAHDRCVLHRDLKPGNIMLGPYGETLVVDWGLAKAGVKAEGSAAAKMDQPLAAPLGASGEMALQVRSDGSGETVAGQVIGTPAYMSPEQATGRLDLLGAASDVYSLGATLYCLLTGKAPFDKERGIGEVLRKVERGEFVLPNQRQPAVPPALEAICVKAMARAPADRYPTPRGLADDLEHWLADEPVSAWPEPWAVKGRRWVGRHHTLVTSAVAVVLVGVVALTGGLVVVGGYNLKLDERRQEAEKMADANQVLARKETRARMQAEKIALQARFDHLYFRSREEPAAATVGFSQLLPTAVALADGSLEQSIRQHICGFRWEVHPLRVFLAHKVLFYGVAVSPDGKTVLTGSDDKTVRLWESATGKAIGKPLQHQSAVMDVAFSPASKSVLTRSDDKTVRLWEAATGKPIGAPMQHQNGVAAVAFSPDGKTVLTGSDDKTARLWEVATGRAIGKPLQHQDEVMDVAFSPDGKTVLTGSDDKTARLWESATGKPIGKPLQHQDAVKSVAFSPNGKFVVTTVALKGFRTEQLLWEAATGKLIGGPSPNDWDLAKAFSPDGKTVVTGSFDNTARVWDAATGQPIGLPLQHQGEVLAVAFSPDGKIVLTGSKDKKARLWETATGKLIGVPMLHQNDLSWNSQDDVQHVAFSPDGKSVLTGSHNTAARLWKAPQPVRGDPERILLWTQVITGLELDEHGVVRVLDADTWQRRRQRLQELGGPPEM